MSYRYAAILIFPLFLSCIREKENKLSDRDIAIRIHKILLNSKKVMYPSIDTVFSGDHLVEFKIYYEHGSLLDTLPKELYLLDSLRKLELRFLGISKLDSLHHMINLKDLDLSFNRLGKTFDCRILPQHLQYLYLQMNNIQYITNTNYLKNLQRVALCNNELDTKVEFYGIYKDSCVGCYPGYTPTYLKNKGTICEGNRKNDPNRIN